MLGQLRRGRKCPSCSWRAVYRRFQFFTVFGSSVYLFRLVDAFFRATSCCYSCYFVKKAGRRRGARKSSNKCSRNGTQGRAAARTGRRPQKRPQPPHPFQQQNLPAGLLTIHVAELVHRNGTISLSSWQGLLVAVEGPATQGCATGCGPPHWQGWCTRAVRQTGSLILWYVCVWPDAGWPQPHSMPGPCFL